MEQHEQERYWAFISYRHTDNNKENDRAWASWLHKEIERYDIPKSLVGTKNGRGLSIPKRIYPVFRDEESLPASSDLSNSIADALDRSEVLICLCSPNAVQSNYVSEEILHFKNTGKFDRIYAAIISGEPGDKDNECFPEPLRSVIGTDEKTKEPIAADFRLPDIKQEGFTTKAAYKRYLESLAIPKKEIAKKVDNYREHLDLMKLKVIAAILGVELETIRDRDKEYQLELRKKKNLILTAVSILALAAIILGVFGATQKELADSNEKERVIAEDRSNINAGKALMEKAAALSSGEDSLTAALLCAQAIGFEGFGRVQAVKKDRSFEDRYPILIPRNLDPELYQKCTALVKEYYDKSYVISDVLALNGKQFKLAGDSLVYIHSNGELISQNLLTNEKIHIAHINENSKLFLNNDSSKIVVDSPEGLFICNRKEASNLMPVKLDLLKQELYSVALDSSGKSLVTAPYAGLSLFNLTNDTKKNLTGNPHINGCLAFSPNDRFFASAGGDFGASTLKMGDYSILLWNAMTGEMVGSLGGYKGSSRTGHGDSVSCVTYNNKGTKLTSGSLDNSIRVWNVGSQSEELHIENAHSDAITHLSYNSEESILVSVSSYANEVKLWSVGNGPGEYGEKIGETIRINKPIEAAFLTSDRLVITSSEGEITSLDLHYLNSLPQSLPSHKLPVKYVDFSEDEKFILSFSDSFGSEVALHVWDIHQQELLFAPAKMRQMFPDSKIRTLSGAILKFRLSEEYKEVYFSELLVQSNKLPNLIKDKNILYHEFSPDQSLIALQKETTINNDITHFVEVRESTSAKLLFTIENIMANDFTFSSDNKLFATSEGMSGDAGHYDVHGKYTGAVGDFSIVLWDTVTGEELLKIDSPQSQVNSLQFSPDNKILLSGSGSLGGNEFAQRIANNVHLWDIDLPRKSLDLTTPLFQKILVVFHAQANGE